MKQKYKSVISLLTTISVIAVFANVNITYSIATVSVDPSLQYAAPGEHFTIDMKVANVANVHTWQVSMYFNSSMLSFVNVTEGDFLRKGGRETVGLSYLDLVEDGYALFTWSIKGEFWESGSGTLATVEFLVLERGESRINIDDPQTILIKMNPAPLSPGQEPEEIIPATVVDGLFFNLFDPPVADFTYSPSLPGINETITFDASASSTTAPLEIVEYRWDFGDGTTTTETDPVTTHSYTTGGTYNASLTVTDNADVTGTLVEAMYNTTTMPQTWFERYSTKIEVIDVKLSHNIAVTDVTASHEEVIVGETVSIEVTVLNKGTEPENFNVIAYYGDNPIETKPVTSLESGEQEMLTFDWDTTGVAEGTYVISAEATDVVGEAHPQDNEFTNGDVTVKAPPPPFPTTLVIAAVVVVVVLVIIVLVYMRRRS